MKHGSLPSRYFWLTQQQHSGYWDKSKPRKAAAAVQETWAPQAQQPAKGWTWHEYIAVTASALGYEQSQPANYIYLVWIFFCWKAWPYLRPACQLPQALDPNLWVSRLCEWSSEGQQDQHSPQETWNYPNKSIIIPEKIFGVTMGFLWIYQGFTMEWNDTNKTHKKYLPKATLRYMAIT